jgi:hypothetical protein
VIGFAKIAGGSPSSVSALTDHLYHNTLQRQDARLAAYYTRGLARQEDVVLGTFAELVANGSMSPTEALDAMADARIHSDQAIPSDLLFARLVDRGMMDYSEAISAMAHAQMARDGSDFDEAHERASERFSAAQTVVEAESASRAGRLDAAVERVKRGESPCEPPLAVLRPDLHPLAAKGLGIDPEEPLTREQINGLLAGRMADGSKIEGKKYSKVRDMGVDPRTGEHKVATPIGSYDFCPTPDKSVSVAWGFAEQAEQAMIYGAHIEAAREAVAYIAKEIGVARLWEGGEETGVSEGHVAWLEFTHHTGRRVQISVQDGETKVETDASVAGDPDLHTHFLIPNAVFCEDGRIGSLYTKRIQGFIFEADAFYQATLAQKLRDAGFDVVMDAKTGAARMVAVPKDVCDLFSKRSNAGEAMARQFTASRGEDWDALSQDQRTARVKAATQSRDQKVKGGKDDIADFTDWKRQAKEYCGWEPRSFMAYGPRAPMLSPEERYRMAYEVAQPFISDKLEQRSVISHHELRMAAGRGLVHAGITGVEDINGVTAIMRQEGVKQSGEWTSLTWASEDDQVSITTKLHEDEEREFVALAKAAADDRSADLSEAQLDRKVKESGLTFDDAHGKAQLAMLKRLGTSGRFSVGIASAGAGKTTALKPLVAAWKEQGRRVFGTSLAWRQADDLADGDSLTASGIDRRDSKAFSVFIDAAKAGELPLNRESVVVVDEFGTLGTRQVLEMLRLREKYGFSLVALGDDRQCGSIQAGAVIDLSRRALGAEQIPEIFTTRRQQTERERKIVGLFREGRAKEALDMKRSDGTAVMVPGGYEGTVAKAAKLYAERLKETGAAPAISAPTNRDAHEISVAVRKERREMGHLGPDLKRIKATDADGNIYSMPLAVGDRVRLFKSTRAEGPGRGGNIGRNGSILDVLAVTDAGMTVRNTKTGREGTIKWESLADKSGRVRLAYGDVMTINTAQGSTRTEHITALPSGSKAVNGLKGYSALTRHTQRSYLLTSEIAETAEVRNRNPLNSPEPTLEDKWGNVGRNLANQPAKDLALSLLDRARNVRRGSVRAFAADLNVPRQNVGKGQPPSRLHEIIARRKDDLSVTRAAQRLREYGRDLHHKVSAVIPHGKNVERHTKRRGARMGA